MSLLKECTLTGSNQCEELRQAPGPPQARDDPQGPSEVGHVTQEAILPVRGIRPSHLGTNAVRPWVSRLTSRASVSSSANEMPENDNFIKVVVRIE